jgi:hypothetical protein
MGKEARRYSKAPGATDTGENLGMERRETQDDGRESIRGSPVCSPTKCSVKSSLCS